jgi:hypothetical protein
MNNLSLFVLLRKLNCSVRGYCVRFGERLRQFRSYEWHEVVKRKLVRLILICISLSFLISWLLIFYFLSLFFLVPWAEPTLDNIVLIAWSLPWCPGLPFGLYIYVWLGLLLNLILLPIGILMYISIAVFLFFFGSLDDISASFKDLFSKF